MTVSALAQRAPTAGDMAMNAMIYGYAGHSLVTPHAALKQLWWTEDRIDAKVTRRFVISKLRGEECEFLRRPLAFAGDLSDRTYLDSILETSKRLFLILAEIGASDQIFGCIDDGWTDDDLPLALEDVPALELSYRYDDALNLRFYKTQFMFLLRTLEPGAHIMYGPQEHIPMDMVNTLPPAVSLQAWDRVHLPGSPDNVIVRRRLTAPDDAIEEVWQKQCLRDIRRSQQLLHQHIAPVWASYASDGATYVLSDFVPEHTLHTFFEHRTPMQFIKLAIERRPVLLCEWMHCLADAVAYLHHHGRVHGAIQPSNIIVDAENNIAFAEIGGMVTFQHGKKRVKHESRDYTAPEVLAGITSPKQIPLSHSGSINSYTSTSRFSFRSLRKLSNGSSGSSSASISSGGYDSAYGSMEVSRPCSSHGPFELSADATIFPDAVDNPWASGPVSHVIPSVRRLRSEPAHPSSIRSFSQFNNRRTTIDFSTIKSSPAVKPEMSDVYSLGCIFLDIITFVLKGKLNEFVKFRSAKVKSASGKISMDTSFHADTSKVEEWIDMLEQESQQYYESIYCGLPDLLHLVRRMLSQDPSLRPSARQIRDRVGDVLAITCGAENLCCADRVWNLPKSRLSRLSSVNSERQILFEPSGSLLLVPQTSELSL